MHPGESNLINNKLKVDDNAAKSKVNYQIEKKKNMEIDFMNLRNTALKMVKQKKCQTFNIIIINFKMLTYFNFF